MISNQFLHHFRTWFNSRTQPLIQKFFQRVGEVGGSWRDKSGWVVRIFGKFMLSTIFILTCIIINFLQILFTIGSFIIVSLFLLSSVFGVFITFFLFLQNWRGVCNCQCVHASMYMYMCIHVWSLGFACGRLDVWLPVTKICHPLFF